ncbi:hypothetical protein ACIRL2_48870 [Embleya sp. NPDC127516]|uniref:hypothetical protein n=1 Tax=Embleya sp. NPDC127516 TaxID=3363990 RepID=UPI00381412DF
MAEAVALPVAAGPTVRAAAVAFLDAQPNPNTARAYATAVGKVAEHLGETQPLASVADDEVCQALEFEWSGPAVDTWSARGGAVLVRLVPGARARGTVDARVGETAAAARLGDPDAVEDRDRPATRPPRGRSAGEIAYRMLYETAARADEILGLNVEELNLAQRRTPIGETRYTRWSPAPGVG